MTTKTVLEDLGMDDEINDDLVSLPNISSAIFFFKKRSFAGASTRKMTLILSLMMRTKKSK